MSEMGVTPDSLSRPLCGALHPHIGYHCTLAASHEGDHFSADALNDELGPAWRYDIEGTFTPIKPDEFRSTTAVCGADRAPFGWWCTRQQGHDGPCAAVPSVAHGVGRELPISRPGSHRANQSCCADSSEQSAPIISEAKLIERLERAQDLMTRVVSPNITDAYVEIQSVIDTLKVGDLEPRAWPCEYPEPTDLDVDRVEDTVGMAHGAWDMVDPKQIIRAAWGVAARNVGDPFRLDGLEKRLREGWLIYFHETDSGRIHITMRMDVTPRSVRVPTLLVAHGSDIRAAIDAPMTNVGGPS